VVVRVWPMVVMGRRFSALVAIQPGHQLQTTGIYRFVRHPSYLGALVALVGWALVFRSGLGVLIALVFGPVGVLRMNAEEKMLLSEFGEEYGAYRRRTWRLVPFLY